MSGSTSTRPTNRLALEASPYLLQHAHNPVDWYPWGDEAFARARAEDKPIFLSVGYATCHWCHVMAEESFEDEEVASLLRERFIAIKVDREERPDVDGIYMAVTQAMSGHGGWPMTVLMTPNRAPLVAGTYFPPRDGERGAAVGLLSLLRRVDELWRTHRDRLDADAAELAVQLRRALRARPPTTLPDIAVVDRLLREVEARADRSFGGLLPAPKFPSSMPTRALLRHAARTGDARGVDLAARAFEAMADGGIYDQVGGGFHRYATDQRWLVPHFEKTLYDNALLVGSALELQQETGRVRFGEVAKDVLAFLERDLRSPEGAFCSATDADSEVPNGGRQEGWYFTWTPDDVRAALAPELGANDAERALEAWGVSVGGNFEGRSVLSRAHTGDDEVEALLARARPLLLRARQQRQAPARDDKVIAGWNGLAISAFARAALVLDEQRHRDVAARVAGVVLERMRAPDGRLRRTLCAGRARLPGMLEDHAFVLQGLLDLLEAGGDVRLLDEARALERAIAEHFEDREHGGFFQAPDDGEALLARAKPDWDGAEPSGNSIHALNLLRMATLFDDVELRERGLRTLRAFGGVLAERPLAMAELVPALEWAHGAPVEVLAVADDLEQLRPLLAPLRERFLPLRVLLQVRTNDLERVARAVPLARGRAPVGGRATVFLCRAGACSLPATSVDEVRRALASALST
ncbi:MAG: thioredoxin domain-containing protein [Deltaproteobacteria bacterium]|nr:thioredoxin domain-containing protein [Deltaproteobacteria bacterium]